MATRAPLLSLEASVTLVCGLVVGVIPAMEWWHRTLAVLAIAALAVHTGWRGEDRRFKIGFPVITISLLLLGTWRSIWEGFHESFPGVMAPSVVAKLVEASGLIICGIAGYVFLLRASAKRGYKVLPAQVIAFGFCMVAAGLVTIGIGLAWQFQQNWASGTTPSGAPVFTVGPPRIPQAPPPPALPAPQPPSQPFFTGYHLTDAGVTALAKELFKIRDAISRRIVVARMSTDETAGPFLDGLGRACDLAGIDCPVASLHPNSPDEKGFRIYVVDPNNPPGPAKQIREALLAIGLDVPYVARTGLDAKSYVFFVGPAP